MKIETPELDRETRIAIQYAENEEGSAPTYIAAGSVTEAHRVLAPVAEKAVREYVAQCKRHFARAMAKHYQELAGKVEISDDDETPVLDLAKARTEGRK